MLVLVVVVVRARQDRLSHTYLSKCGATNAFRKTVPGQQTSRGKDEKGKQAHTRWSSQTALEQP